MNYAQRTASELCKGTRDDNIRILGGRAGTVIASKTQLVEHFDKPLKVHSFDEKVTMRWLIETPRGPVEIRDYWWNGPKEWSIGAMGRKETKWAIRFLRSKSIKAGESMGSARV